MIRRCRVCDQTPCYDHCIYCGLTETHTEDCPRTTGMYPVTDEELLCSGGCGCVTGLRCCECDAELVAGDHYALLPIDEHISALVCLLCAAKGDRR